MLTAEEHKQIYRQCELQGATSPEELLRFERAYMFAKYYAQGLCLPYDKLARHCARLTMNSNGHYATVPRVFANGHRALHPALIERAMSNWAEAWRDGSLSPNEIYEEFERIHPFVDGNGRVGHLLWAYAMRETTGQWPVTLPPDLFSQ